MPCGETEANEKRTNTLGFLCNCHCKLPPTFLLGDRKEQHKLFGPHSKTPSPGPPEKSSCASFPGKERNKGTHINFLGGGFGGQKRGPKQAILGHKRFSLCFFSCLCFCSTKSFVCSHVMANGASHQFFEMNLPDNLPLKVSNRFQEKLYQTIHCAHLFRGPREVNFSMISPSISHHTCPVASCKKSFTEGFAWLFRN